MSGCIPYRRRPPPVRNMRAVLKKASWCTRRVFIRSPRAQNRLLGYRRDIRYQKPPYLVRDKPMCTGKGLLVYRMKRRNAAPALRSVILRKTAICILLLLPLNSCRQLWAATKPLQTTANRHKIATKPLQIATDCHGLPQTTANSAKLSQAAASYS